MKLSLNWLKEYIKIKQTPEELAEILTLAGIEVEEIEKLGRGMDQIVIGQIKTIIDHAEAQKLSVCKVDIGQNKILNIVCGAKNIKPGHKVPVALVGATLPNGIKIEARKIRGIDSEGMLCAEDELGVGEDHSGILILDKDLKVGQKLGKATGLDDVVFDLSLTPNRADWFSVLGIARELAGFLGQKLNVKYWSMESLQPQGSLKSLKPQKTTEPQRSRKTLKPLNIKKLLSVKVEDNDLCPKYVAKVVTHLKVGESPAWLKSRLIASGMKPINNIVDIANYVMLEMGQPLHTFDYEKVNGKKIIVRQARKGEKIITLDGEERDLESQMLVIADSKKPIAVAGVIGGKNSEITRLTKTIVIESAIFKPISIRKTRQKLGLTTEASMRFEKGIWQDLPQQSAERAAAMMCALAGGEVVKDSIIISAIESRKPLNSLKTQKPQKTQKSLRVSLDYINKLIGHEFALKQVKDILESLRFKVEITKDKILYVTVPNFRQDVKIPADVVEEVGRFYGWNNIKPVAIYGELEPTHVNFEKYWERAIKDTLVACGMTETLNYSFYNEKTASEFGGINKHYRVLNPLNPDQEYLRVSLLPKLIENISKNAPNYNQIKLFEIGHVYLKSTKEMPDEKQYLSALIFGKKYEFYQLKGIMNELFEKLNIKNAGYNKIDNEVIFGAEILLDKKRIGVIGNLDLAILVKNKISGKISALEINFDKLIQFTNKTTHKPISDFPAIERDLAFVVASEITYADLIREIQDFSPLIVSAYGFDLYQIDEHKKSMAFRLVFQAPNRTLKSEEVDEIVEQIAENLCKKFRAQLRK